MRRYTRIILTAKVTARAALISSTKLAAKKCHDKGKRIVEPV